MITYLIVLGKTSFAIMLFYLFYRYILAKDKLFMRNRIYLLSSSILAFVLPWIHIPIISVTSDQTLSYAYINNTNSSSGLVKPEYQSISWMQIILLIYIAGAVLFLLKSLISYFQVFKLIKKAFYISTGRFKIVTTARKVSPFSFFNWIVIPEKIQQHPSFDKMVQHEIVHCRQYHSVDLFICELLIILQWFNPFAWLIRRAVSENLEYLVDEEMLTQGTDARDYQYSLLSFSMGGFNPAVANNFNTHLLKKRIIMMNTNKYSRNHRLHNLLIPVCLVFALLLTASFRKESVASTSREHNDFVIVQENGKATPPSSNSAISSEDKLLGFIMKNIVYPKEALENNFGGEFDFAVKFTDKGVVKPTNAQELTSVFKNAKRLDEIVIVGYQKNVEKKANSDHKMLVDALYDEVWRVLKSFKETKDLVGKSFVLHLKFTIANTNPSVKEMVNEKSHENKNEIIVEKQQIRNIIGENKRPTFILNEEKIITENEMENINPESIESVNVIKGETYENKKLGTIKGDVIIIKLK